MRLYRSTQLEEMGGLRIILARSKPGRGKSYLGSCKDCSRPLSPFYFHEKTIDLSCTNAIFTFGLLEVCAHVICLRKRNENKTADLNGSQEY